MWLYRYAAMMLVISLLRSLLFMIIIEAERESLAGLQNSSGSSLNLAYRLISSNNFSFSTRSYFLRLSESRLKNSEFPTL